MNHSLLIAGLRGRFEAQADAQNAEQMSAYMKHKFVFHGLKAPVRRKAAFDFMKAAREKKELNRELCLALWEEEEREYQLVAIDYLMKTKRYWQIEDLDFFKRLIVSKSWWDTVDMLATTMVGGVVAKFSELKEIMEDWNADENLWLIRTSVIYQLKYKGRTDFDQLKRHILAHRHSKEFFINKASGWALRQHSRVDPKAVRQFIDQHELPGLTVREGSKYLP